MFGDLTHQQTPAELGEQQGRAPGGCKDHHSQTPTRAPRVHGAIRAIQAAAVSDRVLPTELLGASREGEKPTRALGVHGAVRAIHAAAVSDRVLPTELLGASRGITTDESNEWRIRAWGAN